jgi:hypothetical protein
MKIIGIFFFIALCIYNQVHSQFSETCNNVIELSPGINPIGDPIALPTRGWNYDNNKSIEFDLLPYNNWKIDDNFIHGNADNYFSNNNKYWSLSSGYLTLKLYDDENGGFDYTAAVLLNEVVDFSYGYYEIRVQLPVDNSLCTSFWSIKGECALSSYREIDFFEFVLNSMGINIYHCVGSTPYWGNQTFIDEALFNPNDWYIFGFEWLPGTYRLFINNHFIQAYYYGIDCVEDNLAPIDNFILWIVKWKNSPDYPTEPFPKILIADYIRIYSLNLDSINEYFYDNWSEYDYGVWKTVKLGDEYDATIDDEGNYAVWATDGITLDAGFYVAVGTEFEAKIYR